MPTTTITADQQYAKHIARRHDHATRLLSIAHESDRQRLRNAIAAFADERQTHQDKTGWAYQVGVHPEPGYWTHAIRNGEFERSTITRINDEEVGADGAQ